MTRWSLSGLVAIPVIRWLVHPRSYLPVESPMPGTTLGLIPLRAFTTGGDLYGEAAG
jgi:hypothetical protein